jgi:hypothetical protein
MPDAPASRAPQRKYTRRFPPAAPTSDRSPVDGALAGFGVVIALSSLAFAGYMVSDVDRAPRIAGMEYLSIFARPSHSNANARSRPTTVVAAAASDGLDPSIDPTPTGSIPVIDRAPTASIPERAATSRMVDLIAAPLVRAIGPAAPTSPYKLLDVLNGEALIQTDVGLRHVRVGDQLPNLGRVNLIEKRGDHWVLQTQSGENLEWPPAVADAASSGVRRAPR